MSAADGMLSSSIHMIQGCVLVSVPADLDDESAALLQDEAIGMLYRQGSRALLLDFSAVEAMDSTLARSVFDIADMARKTGARAAVVGIGAGMASALALLGFEAGAVKTALNVDEGLQLLAGPERLARRFG